MCSIYLKCKFMCLRHVWSALICTWLSIRAEHQENWLRNIASPACFINTICSIHTVLVLLLSMLIFLSVYKLLKCWAYFTLKKPAFWCTEYPLENCKATLPIIANTKYHSAWMPLKNVSKVWANLPVIMATGKESSY